MSTQTTKLTYATAGKGVKPLDMMKPIKVDALQSRDMLKLDNNLPTTLKMPSYKTSATPQRSQLAGPLSQGMSLGVQGVQMVANKKVEDAANSYTRGTYGTEHPDFDKELKARHWNRASTGIGVGASAGSIAGATLAAALGTGAALGSWAGPIGVGVGILGGLIYYLATKNKDNKEVTKEKNKYNAQERANMLDIQRQENANVAKSYLVARSGMQVPEIRTHIDVSKNVIIRGKLHKENNNLGNRDKGVPVIDAAGNKELEFEKEELILNRNAAIKLDKLTDRFNSTHNNEILIQVGKDMTTELLSKTKDLSGKYL
jgi:hypothetical protein